VRLVIREKILFVERHTTKKKEVKVKVIAKISGEKCFIKMFRVFVN